MKSRIDKTEYKFKKYLGGTMFWFKNGLNHRDNDKPAIVYHDGDMSWHINGKLHRDNDKPAVIYSNGTMSWWENGFFIKEIIT